MRSMFSYTQAAMERAMKVQEAVCSTGGRASPRRNGCRWRWWSKCWGSIRLVFRSERAAFPREVAARAPDRAELHLGEAGVARCRTGEARVKAGRALPAASAAASARDAVAHRRLSSPLVSG